MSLPYSGSYFEEKGGEEAIIIKLLQEFDNIFTPELYKKAEDLKMTVDEIVILASIIESEAVDPLKTHYCWCFL